MKISFIVIGKNEGWKLLKCIQSIIDTVAYNQLLEYEIIYVDSNSEDDSIGEVKKYKNIKVFKLLGDVNAAIARNVGANESRGGILFFLDGDMELNKNSFMDLFDKNLNLKYDFVSGDFQNHYYNNSSSKVCLSKEMYHKNTKIKIEYTTGGLFVINRTTWFLVDGMRNVFRRSQDIDLGLRLSKKGIFLYRLPITLAYHHTVNYNSKNRLWSQLKDSTHLYGRSLLYRKNILNINVIKLMIKQDYSLVLLILFIFSSLLFNNVKLILLYLFVLVLRSASKKNIKYLLYYAIRDIKVLFGFIFFHPMKNDISYILVK